MPTEQPDFVDLSAAAQAGGRSPSRVLAMETRLDSLIYDVIWQTRRVLPMSQTVSLGAFGCTLDGEKLMVSPLADFETEQAARDTLEPLLEQWALQLELDEGHRVEFRISSSRVVPADESHGPVSRVIRLHDYMTITDSLTTTQRSDLPSPTGTYRLTPRGERYLKRLRDLRDGREKAPAATYALLTDLTQEFGSGNRKAAARALDVSESLLRRVQRLSSTNHPEQGRKTNAPGGDPDLTDADLAWLAQAAVALVRRAVAVESGAVGLQSLTAADIAP